MASNMMAAKKEKDEVSGSQIFLVENEEVRYQTPCCCNIDLLLRVRNLIIMGSIVKSKMDYLQ